MGPEVGLCPKAHVGTTSAPNKMGERDVGREESRLISFVAVRNYKITRQTRTCYPLPVCTLRLRRIPGASYLNRRLSAARNLFPWDAAKPD